MSVVTLRPSGDGTTTGWTRNPASGTFASKIVDDPDSNDADTSYVLSPNVADGTIFVELDDVPADFDPAAINSITIKVAHRRLNTPQMSVDAGTVNAFLTRADETTAISTTPTPVSSPIQASYALTSFTPSPTGTHTVAEWNGARLALVFDHTSNQTVDTVNQIRITATEVTIDYTPAAASDDLGTPAELATGAPVLDTPALAQVHALTADGVAAGSPTLDTPAIAQGHVLAASGVDAGAPTLGAPTLAEDGGGTDALTADNLDAGAPALDTPGIGQAHLLEAVTLDAGAPELGTPTLTDNGATDVLTADNLVLGAPLLGNPELTYIESQPASYVYDGAATARGRSHRARSERRPPRLHPEEIARQQREDERYLAEQEKRETPPPATVAKGRPGSEPPPRVQAAPVPNIADTLARAVPVQLVEKARTSAALATMDHRLTAVEKRQRALMLLALL